MSAAVMLQGTGSDVGKSLLSAGLCRAYTRRGLKVRPFKPQNMSNNAAVTVDGGEIGRAQALQARACGVPATVETCPARAADTWNGKERPRGRRISITFRKVKLDPADTSGQP